jgi:hypothetical protein
MKMILKGKQGFVMAAVLATLMLLGGTNAYSEDVKAQTADTGLTSVDNLDHARNDIPKDGTIPGIKSILPPIPYKDEGLAVLFPTYIGMMAGGLAGIPLGMVIALPAGIVGYGIFPIIIYETGKDPEKDNPVPLGTDLAVMSCKPVVWLSYGMGYIVGFPFLAVKKIVYDLPKSLFYDPFHPKKQAEQAVK